jgi:hypothetical protein
MPRNGIGHLTIIYNAIIRTGNFPIQWKVAQITMIQRPGKLREKTSVYTQISLFPKMSEIFKKAMLKKLQPILEENRKTPRPSLWMWTETLYHRTSTPKYRDNNRNLLLCGAPRRHTSV